MCGEYGWGSKSHHHEGHHRQLMGFPPLVSVDEEVRMLEEYKEALTKQLEKVNKRLEALKR
jgi:citrate lyase synthetase